MVINGVEVTITTENVPEGSYFVACSTEEDIYACESTFAATVDNVRLQLDEKKKKHEECR